MTLQGRYIGIDGSSSKEDHRDTRAAVHIMVRAFVRHIFERGGSVVTLVSGDPRADDSDSNTACTFIWTILEEVHAYARRQSSSRTLCRAVLSRKTKTDRIPQSRQALWMQLLEQNVIEFAQIAERDHMGVYIRTMQVASGDAGLLIGGGKGVQNLAGLYQQKKKPVIPLDADLHGMSNDGLGAPELNEDVYSNPGKYAPSDPRKLLNELPLLSFRSACASPDKIAERLALLFEHLLRGSGIAPMQVHDQICSIADAVVNAGLAMERPALMAMIEPSVYASWPVSDVPKAQILNDLSLLYNAPSLGDGTRPLCQWLKNAAFLMNGRPEVALIRQAIELFSC